MGNNIDQLKIIKEKGIVIFCGIIGSSYIGKRSIARKYVEGLFKDINTVNIGYECYSKNIIVNNQKYIISICVGGNQSKFCNIINLAIKNALFGILVYDITNSDSFNELNFWIEKTKKLYNDIIWILLGNKSDLNQERKISTRKGKEFA